MIFILVLILAATAIAGSAAFFSVYGLAYTFSGTFWSVVVMGASLELGKLVAASYLYRYWNKTHIALKVYLMSGVLALMLLTSTGIFGYLSSGYQTDVLPLKQAEEQVKVLEEEKSRLITRKTQIDNQIAQLPQNSVKGRTQLIKGFKDEQATVTARISELDKEILENKTKLIQTQAHIGPITYIATAFGLESDNATKYLIYLIIFAFDPMAVALTLCVNIAQRLRREEIEEAERAEHEERMRKMQLEHEERMLAERFAKEEVNTTTLEDFIDDFKHEGRGTEVDTLPDEPVVLNEYPDDEPAQVLADEHDHVPEPLPEPTPIDDADAIFIPHDDEPKFELTPPEEIPVVEEEPAPAEVVENENQLELDLSESPATEDPEFNVAPPQLDLPPPQQRHYRPYSGLWTNDAANTEAKLGELISHYNWLRQRKNSGDNLSPDEIWEFQAIEDVLRKHGYSGYI